MKTILALVAALFIGNAVAQDGSSPLDSSTGSRHMFEFNADSVLQGVLSLDKSKVRGSDADNDSQLNLRLNYAYSLPQMPRIQVGARFNYLKDTIPARGDAEDYSLQIGAIYNHSADLRNSVYLSGYVGLGWANTYKGTPGQDRKDEVLTSTLALGKRFSLENWGINHLTYTPEIALQSQNSTTGKGFEYTQNLQFRFLQFAVFF
ncbi:MAG TPA: hypothetical protein VNJ01_06895 [Bacteriovoracaceae bacterium]|nr:hypothetical protein [Bacteriovoracaceae bacterium]